jgi:WD40 repeat protein
MSLYFDTRVQNLDINAVSSIAAWHSNLPFLAVAFFSENKGSFVNVYDDQGELLPDVKPSGHSVAKVTALAWHPERKCLVATWENGELRVYQ